MFTIPPARGLPVLLAVGLAVIACTASPTPTPVPPSPTPRPDVAALVQTQLDAIGRGDVAAVMALFADDAIFEGAGLCGGRIRPEGCNTKADIQKEIEREVADHTKLTITAHQVSGDALTGRVEVRFDGTKQCAGVERIVQPITAQAKGGKIAALRAQIDTGDQQTAAFLGCIQKIGALRQHYDAVSAGDVATAASFFTDDASLLRGACSSLNPCKGRAQVQQQMQREVNGRGQFTVLSAVSSGSDVSARLELRNPTIQGTGIERVIYNVAVAFAGDKIARITHEIDTADAQSAQFTNFTRVSTVSNARVAAFRRGDVAAVMSFFADDARYEGFGLCTPSPCAGKAAIQREMARALADHYAGTEVVGTARVTGDTLVHRIELRSDSIKAAGVERVMGTNTVEIKGDKIILLRVELDQADPQTATYLKSLGK